MAASFIRKLGREDLDYKDKNVVVIGSGATAATLIPAIAGRSPATSQCYATLSTMYFITGRNAIVYRRRTAVTLGVDETWIHEIVRRKILREQDAFTHRSFSEPEVVKKGAAGKAFGAAAGPDCDIEQSLHAEVTCPGGQRIAFVPDADLFAGNPLRQGIGGHR